MAIQTTTNLSNSVRTRYVGEYAMAAMRRRLYDQFATPYTQFAGPLSETDLSRGSSITIPILSGMAPGTTAISQTADVTPQTLRDSTLSFTPTSRGEALQWSEAVDLQVYTNYGEERFRALGENQMMSVDLLAQAAALQGTLAYSYAARASLDAGTSTHRASDALFSRMQGWLQNLQVPGFVTDDGSSSVWACLMHPYPFHDIRESGNVDSVGLYQDRGIHLNYELGQIGPFRLVVDAQAKVFWAAGLANGTPIGTTLAADANALATTISVTINTNITAGDWMLIGNIETGNTHYSKNEYVYVTAVSGTDITILGNSANGGLVYDHLAGVTVSNADNVYPLVFGGPASLVKLFASDVGEFGMVVGPEEAGLLHQFRHIGWKYYGGYSRFTDARILRVEVSSSYEA